MWVEGKADDLHLVALERVVALASVGIPNLGLLVEGARHNFITTKFEFKLLLTYPNGLLNAMQ